MFVVIATHGRAPLLERALASLAACRRPKSFRGTIVIENGSRDGAEGIVAAADPGLAARYLHDERANKSAALNIALEHCPDAFVVFLDDDGKLSPGLLEAYAAAREQHPGRHFFGGPCVADWEAEPPEWLKPMLPGSACGWSMEDPGGPIREAVFLGFNWAAEAADIVAGGGFDPARGPGTTSMGQESDMMLRMMNKGWTGIYVAEASAEHYVPRSRCSPEWAIARASRLGAALAHGCRLTGQPFRSRAAAYASLQPLVAAQLGLARLRRDEPAITRMACTWNRRNAFIRETLRGTPPPPPSS